MLRNNFNNMQLLERDSLQENRQTRRGKKSSKLIPRLIRISETAHDGRVKPDGYRSAPAEGPKRFPEVVEARQWEERWCVGVGSGTSVSPPQTQGRLGLSTARVQGGNGKHCTNWVKERNKANEIFSLGLLFMLLQRFGPQSERRKQHMYVCIPVLP